MVRPYRPFSLSALFTDITIVISTKLHNEELHKLYSSPHIIRMMKSRRMGWAGYVAHMGEKRNVYIGFRWEIQKEIDH
jgi:hypothetical protein